MRISDKDLIELIQTSLVSECPYNDILDNEALKIGRKIEAGILKYLSSEERVDPTFYDERDTSREKIDV